MFSCNVVSRWAQLVSFLNCLQDVKLSRIAIYRDEFRRMNCSLNWSFISCGELHCDSVKIKTMINSSLFFSRQCESLDWSDCLVAFRFFFSRLLRHALPISLLILRKKPTVLQSRLFSATHFRKSAHARLIRGCFSFSQCFRAGVFSSLSPPPLPSPWLIPFPPLFKSFNMARLKPFTRARWKRLHCRLSIYKFPSRFLNNRAIKFFIG